MDALSASSAGCDRALPDLVMRHWQPTVVYCPMASSQFCLGLVERLGMGREVADAAISSFDVGQVEVDEGSHLRLAPA